MSNTPTPKRGQGNFSERPECHSKTEAAEPASLQDRSRGAGALAATTYVNMFEGPVTGNIPEVLDNGEVTDGTHVTAGQLALALTPYAQVTDTAASGNNAAAIQSLDDRVTAELASKLDSSALAPAIAPLATTDGQVAAHGSSIAALQSSLTTGLSNKADQSAFDVLEGVVATKSTPEAVQLQHHGGHERLHRLGQQRHAGHGGRQLRPQDGGGPALPRHSGEDHAAGGRHQGGQRSPGGRHRRRATVLGLQQRPSWTPSPRLPWKQNSWQGGRKRAGLLRRSAAGTPASRRSRPPRPTRRCWPHTPRTPRSPPARPRSRAPSTQSSRSSPPCSFPAAELLTRRPGRASRLGSSFAEATSFATCTSWLLSLLRWPTATTR